MVRQNALSQSISSPSTLSLWGNRYASYIFLFLAGLLLLISSLQPKFAEQAHINVANITAPVLDFASRPFVHIANTSSDIGRLAALQSENARLMEENQKLRQWYLRALALNTEVESLRALSNLKVPAAQSFVTTRIIADPGNAYVRSLLAPVGTTDGVEVQQAVMSENGLAGRIISTHENVSRILLITDVNSRIPVFVEGARQKAILSGQNTDIPLLTHLPKDIQIEPGTLVLTSGHGGYFPMGLPVGRIVVNDDGRYGVRPFSDLRNLLYVRIIKIPVDPNLIEADLKK